MKDDQKHFFLTAILGLNDGEKVESIKRLSSRQFDILAERFFLAQAEGRKPKGGERNRSRTDFKLLCWVVDCRIDSECAWLICQNVGKFAAHGKQYFELTLQAVLRRVK